jgi:hypothetical protein
MTSVRTAKNLTSLTCCVGDTEPTGQPTIDVNRTAWTPRRSWVWMSHVAVDHGSSGAC